MWKEPRSREKSEQRRGEIVTWSVAHLLKWPDNWVIDTDLRVVFLPFHSFVGSSFPPKNLYVPNEDVFSEAHLSSAIANY